MLDCPSLNTIKLAEWVTLRWREATGPLGLMSDCLLSILRVL